MADSPLGPQNHALRPPHSPGLTPRWGPSGTTSLQVVVGTIKTVVTAVNEPSCVTAPSLKERGLAGEPSIQENGPPPRREPAAHRLRHCHGLRLSRMPGVWMLLIRRDRPTQPLPDKRPLLPDTCRPNQGHPEVAGLGSTKQGDNNT